MIDHTGYSVTDFDKSKAFFDAAFAPLGITFMMMAPPEHTKGVKVGSFGTDRPRFWLNEGAAMTPPVHIAFEAADRAAVDAFYAAGLAAGGRDNGAPGPRPHYHPDYYGAFLLDPDGNNVEAVCHTAS
ncbi:catechol 2,3-dioxygenase-like lactoylglutathione lyase family enzyme [Sulfitobacter undariae]|uniref:Catechol 2,3-dioxygenase-like lactoylglutathione lyase family enzyme n=1 Tax=Sulfitobacter undariae TaxID=1563671 RepID=A0A7W6E4R3_9RHOB|nr:VOC family protein [Sulfitobacter undariae]MBB3994718.1 catechol 2,3-dioxygenase-like lactoylglutathione lyase family enzyme [Sulfitobacter undariae]